MKNQIEHLKYDFTAPSTNNQQPLALINADLALKMIRIMADHTTQREPRYVLGDFLHKLEGMSSALTKSGDSPVIIPKAMDMMAAWMAERDLLDAVINDRIDEYLVERLAITE